MSGQTIRHPRKIVQAKHIPDDVALRVVHDECVERKSWAMGWNVAGALPGVPPKVVQAKLARLLERGLLTGCACGCRGDWELTAVGAELLGVKQYRDNPMERA